MENQPPKKRSNPEKDKENCPIAATVCVLGDRWSILIMRDLLLGLRRFDELLRSLGIATNILTNRLNRLTAEGLISKQVYQTGPTRFEYVLTPAGEDFRKVILSIGEWGKDWRMTPRGRTPLLYVNESTGNPLTVRLVDSETGVEVAAEAAQGQTTEWADEIANWRFETARSHHARSDTKR